MHRQKDKSISRKGDGDTDREREEKWEIERERERESERERERERKSGSKRDQYTDRRAPGHNPINGHTDTRAPGHNPDSRAHGHTGKGHQSTALIASLQLSTAIWMCLIDYLWSAVPQQYLSRSLASLGEAPIRMWMLPSAVQQQFLHVSHHMNHMITDVTEACSYRRAISQQSGWLYMLIVLSNNWVFQSWIISVSILTHIPITLAYSVTQFWSFLTTRETGRATGGEQHCLNQPQSPRKTEIRCPSS